MKRVGIITHYYNSINYGGVLQAYALVKVLRDFGVDAEQISYDSLYCEKKYKKRFVDIPKIIVKKLIKLYENIRLKTRFKKFNRFRNEIPHSSYIYNDGDINNAVEYYDLFVTGSDQVWNPMWYKAAYFLDFVPPYKKKVSYAASIGKKQLTNDEKELFSNSLKDYKAISVREKDSVSLLEKEANVSAKWVLDPTLLLDIEEWDKVATARLVKQKYIFCYFIGEGKKIRKVAKEYAKRNNLKLVVLSHPAGFNFSDLCYGDVKVYEADPSEFISLIKYADCVFTDSFHACVFSYIYQNNVYVFPRHGKEMMGNRIVSFLSMFGGESHYCNSDSRKCLSYLEAAPRIDFNNNDKFKQIRQDSLEYLKEYVVK